MTQRVAIIGAGHTSFSSTSPAVSYKEMIYEAAEKAYQDAGVNPRRDVDSFVAVSEDFQEGTSIFDEYTPDQLGAALRPVHTITGDGIQGLIAAHMLILTGIARVVAVEAHSKASNVLTPGHILHFAMDPLYNRPLGAHPYFVAGLEMNRFLHEGRATREQCAMVVAKNKANALANPSAGYGARISTRDVLSSSPVAHPISRLDVAPSADGAIVLVLASEERAGSLSCEPVWIRGVGWASETSWLETHQWGEALYARLAGDMAYRMAGIRNPAREIDLAELDDTFSYKELQHMEALRLCRQGEAGHLVEEGTTELGGDLPVNTSGGSLGVGYLFDASGLHKVLEVVQQLRGEAGRRQVEGACTGLAQSWRGIPTTTGAVVVMGADQRAGY